MRIWRTLTTDRSLRRMARNTGWLYGAGTISSLLILLQGIIAARVLGAETYGLFAIISAAGMVVNQFLDVRTWEAITRFLPRLLAENDLAMARGLVRLGVLIDVVTGAASFLVTAAVSALIATYLVQRPDVTPAIVAFAASLPFYMIGYGGTSAVLRVQDLFSWLSIKSVLSATLRLTATVGFLAAGFGLYGLIWAHLLTEAVNAIAMLVLAKVALDRATGPDVPARSPAAALREVSGLSGLLFQSWISGTLKGVYSRADILVLSFLATPVQVGYYRVALDLAGVIQRLGSPLQLVIMPDLSRILTLGQSIRPLVQKITLLLGTMIVPVALVVTLFQQPIIVASVGWEYLPMGPALVVLVWAFSVNLTFIWVRSAAVVKGRVGLMNWVALAMSLLEIALLFALIPSLGALGAAIAVSAVHVGLPLITIWAFSLGRTRHRAAQAASPGE